VLFAEDFDFVPHVAGVLALQDPKPVLLEVKTTVLVPLTVIFAACGLPVAVLDWGGVEWSKCAMSMSMDPSDVRYSSSTHIQ